MVRSCSAHLKRDREFMVADHIGEQEGKFHHLIVNESVDETYEQLKAAIAADIALAQEIRAAAAGSS
jgi:hypothetical protein